MSNIVLGFVLGSFWGYYDFYILFIYFYFLLIVLEILRSFYVVEEEDRILEIDLF